MKYFGALVLVLFITSFSYAQSADKGKLFIDLDGGIAAYSIISNENHNRVGAGVARITSFGIGYNIHHNFNLGIELNSHQFLLDTVRGDKLTTSVVSGTFTFRGQYHLINNEKLNLYVGVKVGWSGLNLSAQDTLGSTGYLALSGTAMGLNIGFRKYFGRTFGIKAEAGFLQLPMHGVSFYINDEPRTYLTSWLKVDDYKAQLTGGYLSFGITFKIGKNKPTS